MQKTGKDSQLRVQEDEGEWSADGYSADSDSVQEDTSSEEDEVPQTAAALQPESETGKTSPPPSNATATTTTITKRKKKKVPIRWDFPPAQNTLGKPVAVRSSDGSATKLTEVNDRNTWKPYKGAILKALFAYGGDRGAVRRFLLFNRGTLVPRRVISYYCRRYYSRREAL
ncbi:22K [Murine mastadenovirus A]|uniref:22K n=1 Tax=Murine mastadenovirus A TaxID=129956 RepID=UPI00001D96C8|nr:22K [Murine mastadenovirus A]